MLFDFPALNHSNAIHYTAADEEVLVKPLGLKAPTAIIPVGLEADLFDRAAIDGRAREKFAIGTRPMLLFLGRLTRKKGLDVTIKAFAQVRARIQNAVLVIAGPDNEGFKPEIEMWLKEYGVLDAVIFTGMVGGDDKIGLLRDSDVFVLQSYTENFGISVVEAIASGTPVVISDKVNLWPDVVEYDAGLVTPCDPERAADAMIDILTDPALRSRLKLGGTRLLAERYSRNAVTRQLQNLYSRIKWTNK